jgi:hypothetical protein
VSTWTQVQHVEDARPRPLSISEIDTVQRLIDRAERMISRRVDVAAVLLDPDGRFNIADVRDVTVAMVLRTASNPGGIRSQTAGPFSQVIDRSVASGRMEITAAEREILGLGGGKANTMPVVDPAMTAGVISSPWSGWQVP